MFLHQIEQDGEIHEFASSFPALNCVSVEFIPAPLKEGISILARGSDTSRAGKLKMSCRLYKLDGLGDPVGSMLLDFKETTEIKAPVSIVVMAGKSIVWRVRKC
jgi:hypothetical protein